MKTLFIVLILALPLTAQQTLNISVTVDSGAVTSVNTWRTRQYTYTTPLVGAINSSVTSVTVGDVSGIVTGTHFMIDNEEFAATGAPTGNVVAVTRGSGTSVAAAHVDKALVRVLTYPTLAGMAKSFLQERIRGILNQVPNAAIQTQLAAKAAADAAIAAAIAAAVQ